MGIETAADHHTALEERLDHPDHRRQLVEESGIAPRVILDRGYRTVKTKAELERLGFSRPQQVAPALAIPMYGPTGERVTHQIRPDNPERLTRASSSSTKLRR